MICWESDRNIFNLTHFRQRSILATYSIMAFLVISAYQGTVVALISAPQFLYPPMDTKEMFLTSDRHWLTYGGGHEWYFQNVIFKNTDLIESKKDIFKFDAEHETHGTALGKLLEQPDFYVYFGNYRKLMKEIMQNHADINGEHPFHASKSGEMGAGYIHVLVKKSCYFKKSLDSVLAALFAAGVYEHLQDVEMWKDEILGLRKVRNLNKNEPKEANGITLKYLWIPCVLIFTGYLLAGITFISEKISGCFH